MIPLPAEVKECSQKSIRLTSYILIQLIDLLCKRLILHANMEICCSFKSFAGGTCGFSYREDRSCISQVVPLCSCQKDISSHLRSCKFSIILSGAGIFETPKDIDDFTICPTHRSNLGTGVGGFGVPLIDVECLKKCTAMAKVGFSRFQKPIGELASVYHRQHAKRLENSYKLATYHLVQNYASRQTQANQYPIPSSFPLRAIGNCSIGYQKSRQRRRFLYSCLSTLFICTLFCFVRLDIIWQGLK